MVDCLTCIISKIPRLDRKDIILVGDFNIDLLNNSPYAKKLLRFSELNGLLQTINKLTRISPTSTSIIDLIFCNMTHVHSSGTLDLFLRDHLPVYLIEKMNTSLGKKGPRHKCTGRTYTQYTTEAMDNFVDANVDLNMLLATNDPTTCWNHLYQSLVSIADKTIPEKQYNVSNDLPAWLTPELLRIDNSGWSVNSSALFDGAGMRWYQRKYHVLYTIRQPIINSI